MLNRVSYISRSFKHTKLIAEFFVQRFLPKKEKIIVFLKGDIGSGKTTFIRYALNAFGILDEEFEGSPTFTIVNEYDNNIFHLDLYRLHTEEEIENIGLFEILDKKGLFFIEWPELLINIKADILMNFEIRSGNTRKIVIDKF